MHKRILDSVRGAERSPGQIRTTQNNLYEYMNDEFIEQLLVNVVISYAQFETILAYKDGNR